MSQILLENSGLPSPIPAYLRAVSNMNTYKEGDALPQIRSEWKGCKFDQSILKRYRKICEIEGDGVPLLFPHSFLGPLHLQVMTHSSFPLKLLGSIHHRNHVIQYKPLDPHGTYDVGLDLGELRRRPQGLEFDLVTKISAGGDAYWESVTTILVRKKSKSENPESPLASFIKSFEDTGTEAATFKVKAMTGKTFGLITKDINPIHMSGVLAKLFGFKRDLAHGMWALGRGTASMMKDYPSDKPIRMDVAFKGPVYMQDNVRVITSTKQKGQFKFFSGKNDRPSIVGEISTVSPKESLF